MSWLPRFNGFWFWVGFLLGLALGLIARSFREFFQGLRTRWQGWKEIRRLHSRATILRQWRRHLRRYIQGQHVAASLFPLEAILLPPRVLPLPPFPPTEEEEEGAEDPRRSPTLTDTLPPGLEEGVWESLFYWPGLSLEEALQGGTSLALLGPLGSGKTTALLHLALQLLDREDGPFPLLVHAADLPWETLPEPPEPEPIWKPLAEALHQPLGVSRAREAQWLATFVEDHLRQGKAIILLDGVDEIPPWKRDTLWDWIRLMQQAYPHIRWVVAVGIDGYGSLIRLGFQPVRMFPWNTLWLQAFLKRWAQAWETYVAPHLPSDMQPLQTPLILAHWLLQSHRVATPLEITLKAWGLWAGDLQGHTLVAAVHAWARRLTQDHHVPWEEVGRRWLQGDPLPSSMVQKIPAQVAVPAKGWGVRFRHVLLAAYGGAYDRKEKEWPNLLREFSPYWELRTAALAFWGRIHPNHMNDILQAWLKESTSPLYLGVWESAKALIWSGVPQGRETVTKALGWILQHERHPASVRLQAAWHLWRLLNHRSGQVFRGLLRHPHHAVRQSAALACGLAKDVKSLVYLLPWLQQVDTLPAALRRALFLTLSIIGTEQAIRALGYVLVNTRDDRIRRDVAEALARNPTLGRQALEEATQDEDLLVRKAAVYGLAQIPTSWARQKLEELAHNDKEWLVRNAAAQALEALAKPSPWIPKPIPPLHQEPWLEVFAHTHGLTLAPGKAAWTIFTQALQKGDPDTRRRALRRLLYHPHQRWVPTLHAYLPQPFPLGDEAWHTLRHYAWAGIPVSKAK